MKISGILCFALSLLLAGTALAQAPTLMLTVKKKENVQTTSRSTSTGYYYGGYSSRSGVETLSYTVELINAGGEAVPNVKISWTIVVREAGGGGLRLIEGVRTTELKRGQKFNFETDVIEMGSFSHSTYGNSRSTNAELVGYLVEAVVDGKAVASAAQPMDIRNKIEEARNAPKRHRF
jgi:hypothetical protein